MTIMIEDTIPASRRPYRIESRQRQRTMIRTTCCLLLYGGCCRLPDYCLIWSGRRGSNPRPQPWQGCALPTELLPHLLPCRHSPTTSYRNQSSRQSFKILSYHTFLSRRNYRKAKQIRFNGNGSPLPAPGIPPAGALSRLDFCIDTTASVIVNLRIQGLP